MAVSKNLCRVRGIVADAPTSRMGGCFHIVDLGLASKHGLGRRYKVQFGPPVLRRRAREV